MTGKALRRTLSLNTLILIAPLALFLSFAVLSCHGDDGNGPRVGIVYDTVAKATDHSMIPPIRASKEPRRNSERW